MNHMKDSSDSLGLLNGTGFASSELMRNKAESIYHELKAKDQISKLTSTMITIAVRA